MIPRIKVRIAALKGGDARVSSGLAGGARRELRECA
jgi:hypothetical protein